MSDLEIRPAVSIEDFMRVREIRNECRGFMTRDQRWISKSRQLLYWWRCTRGMANVYLAYAADSPVGYGIVRSDTISGGITTSARGQGYGKELFQFLTETAPKPAYLEVLATNHRAKRMYQDLGWVPIQDQVIVMAWRDR